MSLEEYISKRDFQKTAEPKVARSPRKKGPLRFVIQKHAASRLHYDLRLEMGGALKSWAVPKGLPYAKGEKHLAVQVEDHPLGYIDFEGNIPQGEYGGGTVMVWDTGTYEPISKNPEKELAGGKLHFILTGKKLHGEWYLVRLKEGDQWLVIKAGEDMPALSKKSDDISVLTKKNMHALANLGANEDHRIKAVVSKKKTSPPLRFIEPMKAITVQTAPSGDWIYEIKFDGWRAQALKSGEEVQLFSRNQKDFSARFPEIVEAVTAITTEDCILDGEIVALDAEGRSSFQLLQADDREGQTAPLYFYVFDLLQQNGRDLRPLPLTERKARLEKLLGKTTGVLRFSATLGSDAATLLVHARKLGLEGLIGKKADSPYDSGHRNGSWIKLKLVNEQEFVIGGYTPPNGTRPHFGALLVGVYENGQLTYTSKVGTGFNDKLLRSLHATFQKIASQECPFANLPEKRSGKWGQAITASEMKRCHWVKPTLVCQVKFTEWTRDEHLRHPVWLGLREDKAASEVIREKSS